MWQGGSLWTGLISGGLTQLQDTRSLTSGEMDKKQYAVKTSGNVTGALGVMAGVEYGALLGTSVMPGVGTVVGSIVGGLLGNSLGQTIGQQAGQALVNNPLVNNMARSAVHTTEEVLPNQQ
ncbi:hypothetical protein DVH26_33895 [Paenibacillus sp. H1-7]|uniref:glycine zipper domain-containing protein n=1 Tax=Paenibacillus sp. H1-7 TaxID=2282849 RepID=UPI001EF9A68B|nr:glycine zipper domain-containing protein [Paenibacillus sp. H1-7]ULL18990.1 hypothetical protein DVH26_33895 [Paenibacillus sp. H1-7]